MRVWLLAAFMDELLIVNSILGVLAMIANLSVLRHKSGIMYRFIHFGLALCSGATSIYSAELLLGYLSSTSAYQVARPIMTITLLFLIVVPFVSPNQENLNQRFSDLQRQRQTDISHYQLERDQLLAGFRSERDALIRVFDSQKQALVEALALAQERIQFLVDQLGEAEAKIRILTREISHTVSEIVVSVVIGPDPDTALSIDLDMMHKVEAQTGLKFTRLLTPTRADYKRVSDRRRALGRPITHAHFAIHSSGDGLQFEDGIADPTWLSQQFGNDMEVVVLGSCASDRIADRLPARYIVSFREDIPNDDAALWTFSFWQGIGEGRTAPEAFARAIERVPPSVASYVEKNW